jgi:hypothetical protein
MCLPNFRFFGILEICFFTRSMGAHVPNALFGDSCSNLFLWYIVYKFLPVSYENSPESSTQYCRLHTQEQLGWMFLLFDQTKVKQHRLGTCCSFNQEWGAEPMVVCRSSPRLNHGDMYVTHIESPGMAPCACRQWSGRRPMTSLTSTRRPAGPTWTTPMYLLLSCIAINGQRQRPPPIHLHGGAACRRWWTGPK